MRTIWHSLAAVIVIACGGGGGGGTGPQVFTSVGLSPDTVTMFTIAPGTTQQFTAVALDQSGHSMSGLPAPSYASDDAAVASIDATSGLVTAHAAGTAHITATIASAGGKTSTPATVTVIDPPGSASVTTAGITFSPAIVHVRAGGTVNWSGLGNIHNVDFSVATPFAGQHANGAIGSSNTASGTFATSGSFAYVCDAHGGQGMRGTVVVH
jgi:plastocyanin